MNLNKFKLFYDLLANSISARDIAHSTKSNTHAGNKIIRQAASCCRFFKSEML